MTDFRGQGLFAGKERRPHIGIVMNFTKPTKTKPSLLSFEEVETFFHEFGHALHGLLSKCTYRSIAGTNVYWDFVELPSQFMENWLLEREVIDLLGQHYQTGEKIPQELFNRLIASSQFMAGYDSVRQVQLGLLDMAWHMTDPTQIQDVREFELAATERTRLLPTEEGICTSVSFSHIFAGGYSAGYYSYKWAEVLDADAFDFFKQNGLFSEDIAQRFKEHILEKGGSEHPMDLYKKFRGREPDPDALLKRDGLL
jgi:peptidyl-dipeptidase Dcp